MKKKHFLWGVIALLLVMNSLGCVSGGNKIFPNGTTERFKFKGRNAIIVSPQSVSEGQHWVWRARFWGHEPQMDRAFLELGYHIVYIDVANMFGSPEAVGVWNQFYRFLTEERGFSSHPVLEGMSRGGLIVFNWAVANPTLPAGIYADNPVCDFKSWPAGKGKGTNSYHKESWESCLKAYGLDEKEALAYNKNPTNQIKILTDAKIPLILVCGDSDSVVPFPENGKIIYEEYKKSNAPVKLILKKGADHHPHSLKDPASIVSFLLDPEKEREN